MDTSVIQGADLWLAVLCGLGLLLVGVGLGIIVSHYLKKVNQQRFEEEAEARAVRRLAEDERAQRITFLEEKDGWYRVKADQERKIEETIESQSRREKESSSRERELENQRSDLRKEWTRFKNQERRLGSRERAIRDTEVEMEAVKREFREKLELAANLTGDEAKEQLLEHLQSEVRARAAATIRAERTRAREEADREARRIVAQAIQRCAVEEAEHVSTSTVTLPGENLKSRIIGKEGRNVRAFEAATGVTVLIDDTPNTVVLSGFDPIKREIARESMARLVKDGRIHPTRIEEVVSKVAEENDYNLANVGEEAAQKAGVGTLSQDVLSLLGKLRYRSSYSQNVLAHSVEVAHLTGLLAAEMGLDVNKAKRIGLLHDIGKAMSEEAEGPHAIVGADFLKRNKEQEDVVNGVASHHGEVPYDFIWGILVSAADAISASRPGARSETMTAYLQRFKNLERIAASFDGVDKCYAVQAGREIRIIVNPKEISDEGIYDLARQVARKIEDELQYPGQIRVTMVRENRFIEYAK